MVAVLCFVASASAQSKVKSAFGIDNDARCSVGLRVGSGVQVVGEYFYAKDVYYEGRVGYNWGSGLSVQAFHVWNPMDFAWTPDLGWWFLDAGVGAFVGAIPGVNVGVAGTAKFGILFKNTPIRLAIDLTPQLGIYAYKGYVGFWGSGVFNGGISATYCF